ncbi:MAG: tRNA ligase [Candidatus Magasanikbacteria bacterium]|nr:tRNA ligase [Candidatus Magasanikbacteria bacterium]
MRDLKFEVAKEVLDLGVKIITARIVDVQNIDLNSDFEVYKNEELEKIKGNWEGKKYKDDPVLEGFRDLHTKVGRSNRDYVASPEGLRWSFLERGRFPHINTLVDIYNLISLKTGLALGAHDIDKVQGNITLRLTKGDEVFIPLGKTEPTTIFPGEYGYVDDENNVICRLEVLQVEPTKVSTNSKDIFVIIEGNVKTSPKYVENAAKEVCELITKFCGGTYSFL